MIDVVRVTKVPWLGSELGSWVSEPTWHSHPPKAISDVDVNVDYQKGVEKETSFLARISGALVEVRRRRWSIRSRRRRLEYAESSSEESLLPFLSYSTSRWSLPLKNYTGMATIHITLSIHHRGRFEREPVGKLSYIGGEVSEIERVNVDTLNGFFISDLLKDIGYMSISEFYWLEPGKELDDGLRLLRVDMDVVKMYEAAMKNGNKINVYIEHPVDQPVVVEDKELTPSKGRRKVCAKRVPTPKKTPKKRLAVVEDDDDAEIVGNVQVDKSMSLILLHLSSSPNTPHILTEIHFHKKSLSQPHLLTPTGLSRIMKPILQMRLRVGQKITGEDQQRGPPTGQSFIRYPDSDKPPTFYVPVDEDDFSDDNAGYHCYESEDLHSIPSDEDSDETPIFPQSNADAPVSQTSMRPVPSQEFWEHLDTLPILPPRYKKPIKRPSTKRDKRNDAPKDKSDPHRTKRSIGTIAGHNKRSSKKRKEAMGEGSAAPQVPASDEDEDMLAEMYYEEILEAAEAEAAATEVGNSSTAAQTAQPPPPMPPPGTTQPQTTTTTGPAKKQPKRRSVKRPPRLHIPHKHLHHLPRIQPQSLPHTTLKQPQIHCRVLVQGQPQGSCSSCRQLVWKVFLEQEAQLLEAGVKEEVKAGEVHQAEPKMESRAGAVTQHQCHRLCFECFFCYFDVIVIADTLILVGNWLVYFTKLD
ncbi:hypothetical protein Ahy_B05g075922 [Arachis hypogaea]|uniref:PB1-like domain-containing protein n=1 Tax=Arachis hypogaea TaxID=3818 RepID=A0A444Z2A4_ARAHY|nr:hypothetical protein Ahy_B05g075922 [Arachis hypogaea]